jgi:hypothetical protein
LSGKGQDDGQRQTGTSRVERKPVHSCCWHATTARALTLITPFSDFVLFVIIITGFLLNVVATML